MDDPKAVAHELWCVLARAHATIAEHAASQAARHALTTAEFAVLEALCLKGPLLLGDLQKTIYVSSGGVTYLVDRLEQRGLVRRKLCPSDRRARYAELTEAGTALTERILPEHIHCIREALASLALEEQLEAIALLRKMALHTTSEAVT